MIVPRYSDLSAFLSREVSRGLLNHFRDEEVLIVGLRRGFEGFTPVNPLFDLVPTEDVRGRQDMRHGRHAGGVKFIELVYVPENLSELVGHLGFFLLGKVEPGELGDVSNVFAGHRHESWRVEPEKY